MVEVEGRGTLSSRHRDTKRESSCHSLSSPKAPTVPVRFLDAIYIKGWEVEIDCVRA